MNPAQRILKGQLVFFLSYRIGKSRFFSKLDKFRTNDRAGDFGKVHLSSMPKGVEVIVKSQKKRSWVLRDTIRSSLRKLLVLLTKRKTRSLAAAAGTSDIVFPQPPARPMRYSKLAGGAVMDRIIEGTDPSDMAKSFGRIKKQRPSFRAGRRSIGGGPAWSNLCRKKFMRPLSPSR
jgi:hypothetical protein